MAKIDIGEWLKSGRYLPEPLRDFHDQKSVFKAMHGIVREHPGSVAQRPSWIDGQVYVIDVFLWFMAKHGWTLQRTRRDGEFLSLGDSVQEWRQHEAATLAAALAERSGRVTAVTP